MIDFIRNRFKLIYWKSKLIFKLQTWINFISNRLLLFLPSIWYSTEMNVILTLNVLSSYLIWTYASSLTHWHQQLFSITSLFTYLIKYCKCKSNCFLQKKSNLKFCVTSNIIANSNVKCWIVSLHKFDELLILYKFELLNPILIDK